MSGAMALVCHLGSASTRHSLQWRPATTRRLRAGEVRVRVSVASVNPIDTKRAEGYGRRVLSLLGAGGPDVVLGNDFAGVVTEVGGQADPWAVGDHVYGLVPTGSQGAHRSEVCVSASLVRRLPDQVSDAQAAVLPYTFCTLWRAVSATGLTALNARGKQVLVNGGGGALGQLAIQLLSRWGAQVTALSSAAQAQRCLDLGAIAVLDRHTDALRRWPRQADVSLNFGAWQDEPQLISRLRSDALGHATTVHPMLHEIDVHGWLRGGWNVLRAKRAHQSLLRAQAAQGRYAWTVFQPDGAALDALQTLLHGGARGLSVGLVVPFEQAERAFAHVSQGRPDRAVLVAESI
jgi:NADPH:quinone reductase-like Zn-dependent oxidoreductase